MIKMMIAKANPFSSVKNVSMPVRIFAPTSMCERVMYPFGLLPHFMEKAINQTT